MALEQFRALVRARSAENRRAVEILCAQGLYGHAMGVLRQELDSMVRVIYLRSVPVDARRELLGQTIGGKRWRLRGRVVTDAAMVQLAKQLHGWAEAVYRFGCAFIHLSAYHAYSVQDPFDALETEDRQSIAAYLNYYHGWPLGLRLSVVSLGPYFSRIFEKIAGNLEVELGELRV